MARRSKQPESSVERKDVPFNIRVAQSEKDAFERAAAIAGVSISTWVRERLRAAAMRELDDRGELAPFLLKRVVSDE
jgi:predicted HicB family RNase H-like nuclease